MNYMKWMINWLTFFSQQQFECWHSFQPSMLARFWSAEIYFLIPRLTDDWTYGVLPWPEIVRTTVGVDLIHAVSVTLNSRGWIITHQMHISCRLQLKSEDMLTKNRILCELRWLSGDFMLTDGGLGRWTCVDKFSPWPKMILCCGVSWQLSRLLRQWIIVSTD